MLKYLGMVSFGDICGRLIQTNEHMLMCYTKGSDGEGEYEPVSLQKDTEIIMFHVKRRMYYHWCIAGRYIYPLSSHS